VSEIVSKALSARLELELGLSLAIVEGRGRK
jgi:hypothetical protein